MKITIKTSHVATLALFGAVALIGCGGTSSSADAGDAGDASTTGDAAAGDGPVLFRLTVGDSCFDVLSVVGTPDDGCNFGVGDTAANMGLLGTSLPFHYDMTAVTIQVGTNGILGGGPILNNMATLVHDADATLSTMTTCMWHENVNSMVTMTADNAFTISVVRKQSMFATACSAANVPAGGMCTSTWTWKMAKSTTKTPATMCK
jgi:hypothetical protein